MACKEVIFLSIFPFSKIQKFFSRVFAFFSEDTAEKQSSPKRPFAMHTIFRSSLHYALQQVKSGNTVLQILLLLTYLANTEY